jgi:hypothetical protein
VSRDRGLRRAKAAPELPGALRVAARERVDHRPAGAIREGVKGPVESGGATHSRLAICLRVACQQPSAPDERSLPSAGLDGAFGAFGVRGNLDRSSPCRRSRRQTLRSFAHHDARLNKVFDNRLEPLLGELAEEAWKDGD